MKILIAEDDLASRRYLFKLLSRYGQVDITVDGMEALDAYLMALNEGEFYDLICLDIMMPKLDGIKVIKTIRDLEKQKNIPKEKMAKIIMTTALNESNLVYNSFESGCEGFAVKPIDENKMIEVMRNLKLIE